MLTFQVSFNLGLSESKNNLYRREHFCVNSLSLVFNRENFVLIFYWNPACLSKGFELAVSVWVTGSVTSSQKPGWGRGRDILGRRTQTRHLLTRDRRSRPFALDKTSGAWEENMSLAFTVAIQKLYLLAK